MTAGWVCGPGPPPRLSTLAISPRSQTSTASSESPIHTPSFSIEIRTATTENSTSSPEHETEDNVVPKVEELDDDDDVAMPDMPKVEDVDENGLPTSGPILLKRPRGRPRKHPISPTAIVKGRSKTGCITCRKRKKKCDETKPVCLHCQKNNVVCEGYPPRSFWKSGRQRKSFSFDSPADLPLLIAGVETDVDRLFLDHFNYNVSRVLSLFADKKNPFQEILMPMALRHCGLMHSLLCLAGSHLAAREQNPTFNERQYWHYDQAVKNLRTDEQLTKCAVGEETVVDDPTMAQTLVMCIYSVCQGEVTGEYRPHMDATKVFVTQHRPQNEDFQSFLVEFFVYHDVANSVTSLDRDNVLMLDDYCLPEFVMTPATGALLGVVDGLFGYMSKIRQLRGRVRARKTAGLIPHVDYAMLSDAQAIDAGLREWVCVQEYGSPRHIASLLYRQCAWIYLHRTIMASAPEPKLHSAVAEGLKYLRELEPDGSTQSILLMPLFMLGCAAFNQDHRPDISKGFDNLEAYSRLGNIRHARAVVERMWEMMDAGDEDSWDWESVLIRLGMDFLVT